ncbi:MAG: M23 family metallopeptidase [Chloroflexales bacterium]|nr:M23 family metallopeptidase [Chloroflexales bacterium]
MTPPEAPTAVPSATRRPLETPTLPTVTTAPTATQPPPSATPAPPTPPVPPTPEPAANTYVFPVDAETCTPSSSHHDYPASDIACPIGTAFVAVTSGVVDFVSWEDRYAQGSTDPADRGGLAVAIVGDDGVRYYGSHLSEVAEGITPGVRVETGQLLGRTGISGNAAGTYPQLHFGISRPTTPEDWATRRGQVWPQKYLAAWRRGEHVTPQLP